MMKEKKISRNIFIGPLMPFILTLIVILIVGLSWLIGFIFEIHPIKIFSILLIVIPFIIFLLIPLFSHEKKMILPKY